MNSCSADSALYTSFAVSIARSTSVETIMAVKRWFTRAAVNPALKAASIWASVSASIRPAYRESSNG